MTDPALPPILGGPRRRAVHDALDAAGIDRLIVTELSNIRWATGFTGSNAVLVCGVDGWRLHTDSRYAEQAPDQIAAHGADADVVVGNDPWKEIAASVRDRRTGVEADHVAWSVVQPILSEEGPDALVATTDLVRGLRAVKDPAELARIRRAAEIADAALAEVVSIIRPGATERTVARALDDAIRDRGATGPAYETIVASGPNSALPHATPTTREIRGGDLVIVDVGAEVDGYRSDMTRTFVVGEPTPDQRRHLDVVREAQQAGVAAVAPGVGAAQVDIAARTVIADAGWGSAFGHGTGHGVGLDIHELPQVNAKATGQLEAGMVLTVEPGVYLPGTGGVRWEDLVVVTAAGAEAVTSAPKAAVLDV